MCPWLPLQLLLLPITTLSCQPCLICNNNRMTKKIIRTVLILGDKGVGKTTFLNSFRPHSLSTLDSIAGFQYSEFIYSAKLQLSLYCSNQQYKPTKKFDLYIFMFDLASLQSVQWVVKQLGQHKVHENRVIVVGNKNDLPAAMPMQKMRAKVEARCFQYFECCGKNGEGVLKILESCARMEIAPTLTLHKQKMRKDRCY